MSLNPVTTGSPSAADKISSGLLVADITQVARTAAISLLIPESPPLPSLSGIDLKNAQALNEFETFVNGKLMVASTLCTGVVNYVEALENNAPNPGLTAAARTPVHMVAATAFPTTCLISTAATLLNIDTQTPLDKATEARDNTSTLLERVIAQQVVNQALDAHILNKAIQAPAQVIEAIADVAVNVATALFAQASNPPPATPTTPQIPTPLIVPSTPQVAQGNSVSPLGTAQPIAQQTTSANLSPARSRSAKGKEPAQPIAQQTTSANPAPARSTDSKEKGPASGKTRKFTLVETPNRQDQEPPPPAATQPRRSTRGKISVTEAGVAGASVTLTGISAVAAASAVVAGVAIDQSVKYVQRKNYANRTQKLVQEHGQVMHDTIQRDHGIKTPDGNVIDIEPLTDEARTALDKKLKRYVAGQADIAQKNEHIDRVKKRPKIVCLFNRSKKKELAKSAREIEEKTTAQQHRWEDITNFIQDPHNRRREPSEDAPLYSGRKRRHSEDVSAADAQSSKRAKGNEAVSKKQESPHQQLTPETIPKTGSEETPLNPGRKRRHSEDASAEGAPSNKRAAAPRPVEHLPGINAEAARRHSEDASAEGAPSNKRARENEAAPRSVEHLPGINAETARLLVTADHRNRMQADLLSGRIRSHGDLALFASRHVVAGLAGRVMSRPDFSPGQRATAGMTYAIANNPEYLGQLIMSAELAVEVGWEGVKQGWKFTKFIVKSIDNQLCEYRDERLLTHRQALDRLLPIIQNAEAQWHPEVIPAAGGAAEHAAVMGHINALNQIFQRENNLHNTANPTNAFRVGREVFGNQPALYTPAFMSEASVNIAAIARTSTVLCQRLEQQLSLALNHHLNSALRRWNIAGEALDAYTTRFTEHFRNHQGALRALIRPELARYPDEILGTCTLLTHAQNNLQQEEQRVQDTWWLWRWCSNAPRYDREIAAHKNTMNSLCRAMHTFLVHAQINQHRATLNQSPHLIDRYKLGFLQDIDIIINTHIHGMTPTNASVQSSAAALQEIYNRYAPLLLTHTRPAMFPGEAPNCADLVPNQLLFNVNDMQNNPLALALTTLLLPRAVA